MSKQVDADTKKRRRRLVTLFLIGPLIVLALVGLLISYS